MPVDEHEGETMDRWSDERLLRAAHQGDPEAFKLFCVRSLPRLHRHLHWQCGTLGVPRDLVGDFTHDTFVRALAHFQLYRQESNRPLPKLSTSWLFQIGHNLVIDWLRRNRKARAIEADRRAIEQAPSQEEMLRFEEVLKFFGWLPVEEQEILELVLLKELSITAAGDQLGLSRDASYKRYERGLKHLQDLLREHGQVPEWFQKED